MLDLKGGPKQVIAPLFLLVSFKRFDTKVYNKRCATDFIKNLTPKKEHHVYFAYNIRYVDISSKHVHVIRSLIR